MAEENQSPTSSYLFSYPFWIVVDTQSPPATVEIQMEGLRVRIYPPFRSAPANFIPMPAINPHSIPFQPGTGPQINPNFTELLTVAAIPVVGVNPQGGASVHLIWGAEWGELAGGKQFPMDSLRIDVSGGAEDQANKLSNELMGLLRWRSRQWWIGRSVDALGGYLRVSFAATENGAPTENIANAFRGGAVRTVRGDEIVIDATLWNRTIDDLRAKTQVPTHQVLLLDAIYFEAIGDIRRCILDCASACELVKDAVYERKRWRKERYDLPKHIGVELQRFGRSYATDHPNHFADIEDLWGARGNIAHSGRSEYWRDGRLFPVNPAKAQEFIRSTEHCVDWLDAL